MQPIVSRLLRNNFAVGALKLKIMSEGIFKESLLILGDAGL